MKQGSKSSAVFFIVLMVCIFPIAAKTLHIQTIEVAPFGFTGADGEPKGMMYEISNRIAEDAELKYTNRIVPYARTIAELQSGNADFVLRFSNELLPAVSIPLVSVISMPIIILTQAGAPFKTLDSLHGKSVGIVRGGKFDVNFDNDAAIHKYEVDDYAQTLRMLVLGRIDGGIGTNVGLYYNANKLGIKPEALNSPIKLSSKSFMLHFSKKHTDTKIMGALKASVEKLKKSGEITKIVNKYMGNFQWDIPTQ